ncbi:SPFH domain / Band 7 family protein [Brevundimonas sp. SH203]|uniref:SPFH domain-containing protein n=1 Tax=Brevundimonas sp. SH203 TaxID=345167 RepID=UPI0009CE4BD9|nr:SPFH domain-containing protein [Brevundimonas sp. SH203]GAW40695.1 SPFH domain / Band 7 family protein [Brevundimonas sp. SH203]
MGQMAIYVPILTPLAVLIGAAVLLSRFRRVRVNSWERTAVYIDGAFDRLLAPGVHRLWKGHGRLTLAPVTLDRQVRSVRADVLSVERMPLRLTASALFRIENAELSLREPVEPRLDLAVQSALIRLAAETPLETLLAQAPETADALGARVGETVGAARVERVEIAAVTLPPEIRRLMSDVERARLDGLAALERARGEQAALRALANAARLLKDNPELAQLRLLQTAENAKAATIVIGDAPRQ